MWARVGVVYHAVGEAACPGGDDCPHGVRTQTYGLLFSSDKPNVIDESASFADQLRQTVENLIRDIPQVSAGEWFTIEIIP